MHNCLQISEILKNIFSNINFPIHRHTYDLYAAALVSKAFLDPALDLLWESHGSFLRLVKTFPVEAWNETGDPPTFVSFRSSVRPQREDPHVTSRFKGPWSRQTLIDSARMEGE